MSNLIEIKVPDIGGHSGVDVIEVLVKPGDTIALEDALITLETDKATMEVPATQAGIVKEVKVQVGSKISENDVIVLVEAIDAAAPPAQPAMPQSNVAPSDSPPPKPQEASPTPAPIEPAKVSPPAAPIATAPVFNEEGFRKAYASPSVRQFARELGVDLTHVTGTGEKKRITHSDVQNFVKSVMAGSSAVTAHSSGIGLELLPWPKVDFAKFGPIETTPLSRIKKISGANLLRNWVMIPHVTFNDEADITELEAFRKSMADDAAKQGIKVSPLAFIIKAATSALKAFPEFNASIEGENLVLKHYYHIGFAADTPHGLVVPVIRDADQKGILQIAKELGQLSSLAREGKLKPTDMQGASFTISSLGGIGGTSFTPIINAPEVAILGVCKSQMKPVWDGKAFIPRLLCPLSLSIDHRVIDGAAAARFTVYLAKLLADLRRLVL
jgi:pyruvate dehydrogenase E2 component (dihydrolipoamide acetyltransferase)